MKLRHFLLCSTLLFSFVFLIGCGNKAVIKKTNEISATPAGTENTATPAPTAGETAILSPEPTLEPLSEDKKGIPQEDAINFFVDQFKDNEYSEEAIMRFKNYYGIIDEQLYLSYENATGEWYRAAQSYAPDIYCTFEPGISQYEYHITFKTAFPDGNTSLWMANIIGIRVFEALGEDYRPSDENSGLYVALSESSEALLYHGIPSQWPKGACKFSLPEGFKEMRKLTIVDANGKIYYYMDTSTDRNILFLKVDMAGDTLSVYDGGGQRIYSADNNLKNQTGVLKLFNHHAKTIVDEVIIKKR